MIVEGQPRQKTDFRARAGREWTLVRLGSYDVPPPPPGTPPDSLGRDLARLHAAGWRPGPALPFDLMPGTAQVETLIVCRR